MRSNKNRMSLLFGIIALIAFTAACFSRSYPSWVAASGDPIGLAETEDVAIPQISSDVAVAADLNLLRDTVSGTATLNAFDVWISEFNAAPKDKREELLEVGVRLAEERRVVMKRLIAEDPKAALSRAVPLASRAMLPVKVLSKLEERVSAEGRFTALLPLLRNRGDRAEVRYSVGLGARTLRAYTYGRRVAEKLHGKTIPIHGIAVDSALAISEMPMRRVEPGEFDDAALAKARAESACPISGIGANEADTSVAVLVGSRLMYVCHSGHIEVANEKLLHDEASAPTSPVSESVWSEGTKKILYIPVRFKDQTSGPAVTDMNAVNAYIKAASYNKTSFATTITPTYTLSKSASQYTEDYEFYDEARVLAKASGFDTANFDLDCIRYNGGPGGFAGLAGVGWKYCLLKTESGSVAAHEFGHNLGLWHANYWNSSTGIGAGSNQEYGDIFDIMGGGPLVAGHYNAYEKSILNWIPPANISTATASGNYRLYAHDLATLSGSNKYAVKVKKDTATNRDYWIEYRQHADWNSPWLDNGIGVRWGSWGSSNGGSQLIDTTPGSADGKNDSPILVGRTFSDSAAGVHITLTNRGGTIPNLWADVQVQIGTFPNNTAPILEISASSTSVPQGQNVSFTANASDANGDALAYHWDFGDKTFGPNAATANKSWTSSGTKTIRCIVSDMKGGTATATLQVVVGTSTLPVVTLTTSASSIAETSATPVSFTFQRSGSTANSLTVKYAASGTASPGSDYNSLSGSITIPAGKASEILFVQPLADTALESTETVTLSISMNASYLIGSPNNATINILNSNSNIGSGTGLRGEYYNGSQLEDFVLTRVDPVIDFTWASTPAVGVNADNFSVVWYGEIQAQFSEMYTLYTTSDDGVRVWVNNVKVIDNWTVHGPTENSSAVSFVAGQKYPIRIEFFESTSGALTRLSWSSSSTPKQVVPKTQLYPGIANKLPVIASAPSATPNPATTSQTVAFKVVATDSDGDALKYSWDFGDGTLSSGASSSHAYSVPGIYEASVSISDGRGGKATAQISVVVKAPPQPPVGLKINFQLADNPIPAGYLMDSGAVFGDRGNGRSFGWNANNSTTARDRNSAASADQRYDTLQHLQKPGNPNAVWEIALPNGMYSVRVVCGDPSFIDSVYKMTVEGQLAVNGTPTATKRWFDGTVSVSLNDGRLTIGNAPGSVNNKICFVDISSLGTAEIPGGPTIDESSPLDFEAAGMTVVKSSLSGKAGRDLIRMKSRLPGFAPGTELAGLDFNVDVGGVTMDFSLDRKARAKTGKSTVVTKLDRKTGDLLVQISLRSGTGSALWVEAFGESQKGAQVQMPFVFKIGERRYGGATEMKFKAPKAITR